MIKDLAKIEDHLIQIDDHDGSYKAIQGIEVILSYSPGFYCSHNLCFIQKKLDGKVKHIKAWNKGLHTVLKNMSALSMTTEFDELKEKENINFKITFS